MDKKTKIFFVVVILLILGSVAFTYLRIMVKKNYIITSQIDCDPYAENCFIWQCDPESDVEGEACTGDPEMDIWYYKVAQRVAANIPLCDPNTDETCLPFECNLAEISCGQTLCDEETKIEQGAECSGDPEEFLLNNPIEEEEEGLSAEEAECEEGDEECLMEATEEDVSDGENMEGDGLGKEELFEEAGEEAEAEEVEESGEEAPQGSGLEVE